MTQTYFFKPLNLAGALQALEEAEGAMAIAGGTDVIPGIRLNSRRFSSIGRLVDISGLEELRQLKETPEGLVLGPALTFSEIMTHPKIRERYPLLSRAAARVGSVQIRNRATIGGNIVNNAPCADSVPPLLVYNASVKIVSRRDEQILPLEEFLVKPYQTRLKPEELISEILLPAPPPNSVGTFEKLGRRRGVAISRITLAALLELRDNRIEWIRLASGAVTPIGKRFRNLEKELAGQPVTDELLRKVSVRLGQEILSITGLRWSSPYKLPVVQQMCYQTLCELTGRNGK